MVSVVCCYNDEKQYNAMIATLKKQDVSYELIGLDNQDGHFTSAATALNTGARKASGDILVFIHQDILFDSPSSLSSLVEVLCTEHQAIIGIFGASHGKQRQISTGLWSADTLDECCVAMSKDTWFKFPFQEQICDGWHLYVVELCLRVSLENVLIAYGEFAITHLSGGNVDENYMKTYKKLLRIYKKHGWIATTCKSMPTNLLYFYIYYGIWRIKKCLLGNYPLMGKLKEKYRNR